MNPFVKWHGLELFGVVEQAKGRAFTEATERTWNQYALDTVYRFLPNDQLFVGVRYNKAQVSWPASPETSARIAGNRRRLVHHRRTCSQRPST